MCEVGEHSVHALRSDDAVMACAFPHIGLYQPVHRIFQKELVPGDRTWWANTSTRRSKLETKAVGDCMLLHADHDIAA